MASTIYGRFYLAQQSFTVNVTGKSTTAGWYFPEGYTGETQLLEHVSALITAVYTLGDGLSINRSTGIVSLDLGATGSITWTASGQTLRDLLGFTGDLSGSDTYTATNPMRYVWVPQRQSTHVGPSRYPLGLTGTTLLVRDSKSTIVVASDGTSSSVRAPYTGGEAELEWTYLDSSNVLRSSDPDPGTYEQLWLDVLRHGERIRVIPASATYDATTAYVEALPGSKEEPIGMMSDYISRPTVANTLWDVRLPFREYVA